MSFEIDVTITFDDIASLQHIITLHDGRTFTVQGQIEHVPIILYQLPEDSSTNQPALLTPPIDEAQAFFGDNIDAKSHLNDA